MSGTNDVPTAVATKKAGAIDFLIKPITHEVLLRAITAAIEQGEIMPSVQVHDRCDQSGVRHDLAY